MGRFGRKPQVAKLLAKWLTLHQRGVVLIRRPPNREKALEIDLTEETVRRRLTR